ncbi:putative transporter YycB [compost metagenome]
MHAPNSRIETRHNNILLIAAIILVAIALRPGIVAIGPVLPAIIADFGLNHTTASLLTTIPGLLMGLLALPTPWLARRYGRDAVLLMSLALLSLSILLRAFAPNEIVMLAMTFLVGVGIAIPGALFGGIIKSRFPQHTAIIIGIYSAALSLGSTVSAALSGPLARHSASGWRMAIGIWSVLGLVAVVVWLFVMRDEQKNKIPEKISLPSKLPLRNGKAWLIALFFGCDNFLFYSILPWTAAMYQEHGVSPDKAGLILACFFAVFMISNPIIGSLSKSLDRRVWLGLCSALTIVGLFGLAITPLSLPFVWVSLAGFGLGGGFTLGMTLPLDNTHSADAVNSWTALMFIIGYLIAASGPVIVGKIRDITGNFQASYIVLLIAGFSMLAMSFFLQPAKSLDFK